MSSCGREGNKDRDLPARRSPHPSEHHSPPGTAWQSRRTLLANKRYVKLENLAFTVCKPLIFCSHAKRALQVAQPLANSKNMSY